MLGVFPCIKDPGKTEIKIARGPVHYVSLKYKIYNKNPGDGFAESSKT